MQLVGADEPAVGRRRGRSFDSEAAVEAVLTAACRTNDRAHCGMNRKFFHSARPPVDSSCFNRLFCVTSHSSVTAERACVRLHGLSPFCFASFSCHIDGSSPSSS